VLVAKHATVRASQLRNEDGDGEVLHQTKIQANKNSGIVAKKCTYQKFGNIVLQK
jgi:hypothetical protein